jgi:2-polyprenyl-3-methyl-5-hydroxy-6-metoxy-1,4-benzoquinol methylase
MDNRTNENTKIANSSFFNATATSKYIDGAPHIKHIALRELFNKLIGDIFSRAKMHTQTPLILDLGAGEGSATLPFLKLGAHVVAVDLSNSQLDMLKKRCVHFSNQIEVRCENIRDTLTNNARKYDIIVANSFLHHVPDYMEMITNATSLLSARGQFFSFQDPLRYDTLSKTTNMYSKMSYSIWRICQGDVLGGISRRLRRSRGIFREDCVHDNTDYHVVRHGVDQNAIFSLFGQLGFECKIFDYFSTQISFFQILGTALGMKNSFSIVAHKQN